MNSEDMIADIDPFEMHRKIRLYQSKLELWESHCCQVEEKLKEIDHVLTLLGVSLEDLKEFAKSGPVKLSGVNVKNFDVSSMSQHSSKSGHRRRPTKKKSELSRKDLKWDSHRLVFKQKGESLSLKSDRERKLVKTPSDSGHSGRSSEDEIKSIRSLLSRNQNYVVKVNKTTAWDPQPFEDDYSKRLDSIKNICNLSKYLNFSNFSDIDESYSPMIMHERSDYEGQLRQSGSRFSSMVNPQ